VTELEQRLMEVEQRLGLLEDQQAITRVILSYGPLVDSGCAADVAGLWAPDGVYDVDSGAMNSPEEIADMVRGDHHQGFITGGCAHVAGPPHVMVTGDEATAVSYTIMIVNSGGFVVNRVTANHWRLRRADTGWQVTVRAGRILDGRQDAPDLLASHFPGATRHAPAGG
jgi:hypothetical protein